MKKLELQKLQEDNRAKSPDEWKDLGDEGATVDVNDHLRNSR